MSAAPPPEMMPSSIAARVAETASSIRCFFSLSSTSVCAPTRITQTPPASLARRSWSFSRSQSESVRSISALIWPTRAAIEEGIVAGGGSALIHAVSVLDDNLGLTGDEATGVAIVRKAAAEPLRWIAENGGDNGHMIVAKVREGGPGTGYNAATCEYGDLVAQGVLDPVKVTRSALVNATSIAGMLLTTETLVVEKPAEEDDSAGAGHGHGHGH